MDLGVERLSLGDPSTSASPNELFSEPLKLPEILQYVMKKIPRDRQTLERCALVSRAFNLECRRFIFSRVKFFLTIKESQLFHDALSRNPEILTFIRELRIESPIYRPESDNDPTELEREMFQGLIRASSLKNEIGLRVLDISGTNWCYLNDKLRKLLITLIISSHWIHTFSLPVCRYCNMLRFQIDLLSHMTQIRNLKLRGSPWYCENTRSDYCRIQGIDLIHLKAFLESSSQMHEKTKIVIKKLELESVGEQMKEYLFYPECPLDISKIKTLHIGGIKDMWMKDALSKVTGLACRSLESVVWSFQSHHPSEMELILQEQFIPPALVDPPEQVHLRFLTLLTSTSQLHVGIDKAFAVLQSNFGIQADKLEVLNVLYNEFEHSLLHELISVRPPHSQCKGEAYLEAALELADKEFKALREERDFPELQKINLLFCPIKDKGLDDGLPWDLLNDWTSSYNWPLACEKAPALHGTEKLYVRMSFSEGENIQDLLEKFSLIDLV